MLIIALMLAVIGLALLVFAVVTSNSLVAWFCIAASLLGVVLLIVDAMQERRRRPPAATPGDTAAAEAGPQPGAEQAADSAGPDGPYEDYPEESDESGSVPEVTSRRAESGVGASEEPGGSDEYDHGTADQSALEGEDTSR